MFFLLLYCTCGSREAEAPANFLQCSYIKLLTWYPKKCFALYDYFHVWRSNMKILCSFFKGTLIHLHSRLPNTLYWAIPLHKNFDLDLLFYCFMIISGLQVYYSNLIFSSLLKHSVLIFFARNILASTLQQSSWAKMLTKKRKNNNKSQSWFSIYFPEGSYVFLE